MAFIYIADGIDDVLAAHLNQYADAWTGVAGKGQPFNAVAVNDPINFAISARNLDPTNSRACQFLKADGTVLFQVDASGVKVSPDGTVASVPATLTATQTLTNKTLGVGTVLSVIAGQGTLTVPAARVYNSAAISVPSAAFTALTFNSERYKTDAGMHSTVTNTGRVVATVAGKYRITAHVEFAASAAGTSRQVLIRLNGVTYLAAQSSPLSGTAAAEASVSTTYALAANDYVEAVVSQDSGGALNVNASASFTPEFSMELVSA